MSNSNPSIDPTEDTPTHEADCPYLYGHNCSCIAGFTKSVRKTLQDDKLDISNPPAQKLDKSGQLREEVGRLLLELIRGKGAVLATEDQILALFQKEQIQLVSELLEHSREYEVTDLEKLDHWNETPLVAIPASVLEHKKQELERGK